MADAKTPRNVDDLTRLIPGSRPARDEELRQVSDV